MSLTTRLAAECAAARTGQRLKPLTEQGEHPSSPKLARISAQLYSHHRTRKCHELSAPPPNRICNGLRPHHQATYCEEPTGRIEGRWVIKLVVRGLAAGPLATHSSHLSQFAGVRFTRLVGDMTF